MSAQHLKGAPGMVDDLGMAELFDQDLEPALERDGEAPSETAGNRIAALRQAKGLSRHAVARAAGFTMREIAAFEHGRRPLTANDRFCIAGSLGVDPEELTQTVDEVPEPGPSTDETAWLDFVRHYDDPLDDGRAPTIESLRALSDGDDGEAVDADADPEVDAKAREQLDRRWQDVQAQLDAAAECCRMLVAAGPEEDVARLVAEVEEEARRLRDSRAFRRTTARHLRALRRYQRVHGTGA